jgi:hypothetical protein
MVTQPTTLYRFVSASHPEFTFYYLPYYSKSDQTRIWDKHTTGSDLYLFLEDLFRQRVVLIEERTTSKVLSYLWPAHDYANQELILTHIPREAISDLMAYVLGVTVAWTGEGYLECISSFNSFIQVRA